MRLTAKIKQFLFSGKTLISLGLTLLILATPAIVSAAEQCENTKNSADLKKCIESNKLVDMLQTIVNVLSAGVGVVVVTMVIIGGIQYMTAGDNPSAVTAAKQRIGNALLALVIFLFTFAFLQWLIPGGVFERP